MIVGLFLIAIGLAILLGRWIERSRSSQRPAVPVIVEHADVVAPAQIPDDLQLLALATIAKYAGGATH